MASVNVRKSSGKLYLDFSFRNIRCREQTSLKDTPANRKKCQALLQRIEAEILLGQFDYAAFFPNSRNIAKLTALDTALTALTTEIPLMQDFALQWFEEQKVLWRKSYTSSVSHIILHRIIPFFYDVPVNEITKEQVVAFRTKICKLKKKDGNTLSPSSINRHMKLTRAILNEAADRFGFVTPYRGIKPLKVPKSDINPLTPEEINQILEYCRADFKDYFLIRIFTGMRTGEIDGLKWKYIDFDNRVILIRETIVEKEISYTKNDFSQRQIQMSQPVFDALKNMEKRTKVHEFVFVNKIGKPLDHNKVTKRVWYPLLRSLNIPKRNPYQMRHTAATLWLASGEAPEWIANQMGHANTEMLFRVYSRYVPNLTRKDGSAAERMTTQILNYPKKEA